MFDLKAFRHTAVYKKAFEEVEGEKKGEKRGEKRGKLEAVPFMHKLGATEEQITAELGLPI